MEIEFAQLGLFVVATLILNLTPGPDMLFTGMPYMVSGTVLEELGGLISKKTRERLDDFGQDHLDIPKRANDLQPVFF